MKSKKIEQKLPLYVFTTNRILNNSRVAAKNVAGKKPDFRFVRYSALVCEPRRTIVRNKFKFFNFQERVRPNENGNRPRRFE